MTGQPSLQDFDHNVTVVLGDVRMLGNEVFKNLNEMETRVTESVQKAIQPVVERLDALEKQVQEQQSAQLHDSSSASASDFDTPPSSKRMRIQRNPDLSVSYLNIIMSLSMSKLF